MAIMEFHDRNTNANIVQGFSDDPTTLKNALQAINIGDNGASAILLVMVAASDVL